MLVAEDGLDRFQVQQHAAPINQGLESSSICPPTSNNRLRLYSTWKFEYWYLDYAPALTLCYPAET